MSMKYKPIKRENSSLRIIPKIVCKRKAYYRGRRGTEVTSWEMTFNVSIGESKLVNYQCPTCHKNLEVFVKTSKRKPREQIYYSRKKGVLATLLGAIFLSLIVDLSLGSYLNSYGLINGLLLEIQERQSYLLKEMVVFFLILFVILIFVQDEMAKPDKRDYDYDVSLRSSYFSNHKIDNARVIKFFK